MMKHEEGNEEEIALTSYSGDQGLTKNPIGLSYVISAGPQKPYGNECQSTENPTGPGMLIYEEQPRDCLLYTSRCV